MAAAPGNNTYYLMNGTVVHHINGRFFASCVHFIFITGQGSVYVPAMGDHVGPCFSNIPLGENPTSALQLNHGNEYGFEYKQGHSMAATFFFDSRRGLQTLPYDYFHIQNDIPLPGPFLSSLPLINGRPEASICSSTHGLVLFRDEEYLHVPDSNDFCYHVINPTVAQDYGSRRLPNPPIPHGPQDSAILTFNEDNLSYNVVCAVQLDHNFYRLDVFNSCTGNWTSPLTLQGFSHISNKITVSCGASAYWIAKDNGTFLLRYNVETQTVTSLVLPQMPPYSKTQLGRIGDTVGLVIAFDHMVELYLLGHQDIWVPFGFLDFSMGGSYQDPSAYPARLLRFESFKPQIVLWFNGEFLLWESNEHEQNNTRVIPLPRDTLREDMRAVSQGFPFIHSSYIPGINSAINLHLIPEESGDSNTRFLNP